MRAWGWVPVLVWLWIACGGNLPPSPPRQTELGLPIHAFRIANNGLRVALLSDPKASQIQVTMRYRVGEIDEPAGREGMAHLAEHLMFLPVIGPARETLFGKLEATASRGCRLRGTRLRVGEHREGRYAGDVNQPAARTDSSPNVPAGMQFDHWVNDNNISETFEYSKGWWDYVELVRRFAFRLGTEDVRVVGHYAVDTPPPCERLPMPAVAIVTPAVTFALRFDFGSWSLKHRDISEWVVSVVRRSPYVGPLFGLIDETEDLRRIGVEGLAPDFLFGSYRQDPARFSCLVRDEWAVATLMRILAYEA